MVSPVLSGPACLGSWLVHSPCSCVMLSTPCKVSRGPLERDVNSTVMVMADYLALIQRTHVSTLLLMAACELQTDWGLISASECVFSCSGLRHKVRD